MRMLAEGGVPILTDQVRRADEDNPRGYFELEAVRQLKEGNDLWLRDAPGKAVKVISALLEYLPSAYHYKIIFMERDSQETLVSQKKMLHHRGQTPALTDEEMEQQFREHLGVLKPWLARQPNMDVLYVNYNSLVTDPEPYCDRIAEFLNLPLNQFAMRAVPDKLLYRNRFMSEA